VDQPVLVTALAGAAADDDKISVEFLLSSMSSRMADNIREEIAERGRVKQSEAEDAMTQIVGAIRDIVDEGTISLIETDDDDEEN
jgi:flagellar motor switch protein FliG